MIRTICNICLFFACACASAQSAPVKIQPDSGNLPPAKIFQAPNGPQSAPQTQEMNAEDMKALKDAQERAAREAAEKKAEENIKKYSSLLPPTEGVTGKIRPGFWESYWGYAVAAAAVLAALAFLVFKPKKKPEPTPFEKAEARLGGAEKVYEEKGAKAYAQEVSQAVRDYIEAVHNLPAPERTTEEFLQIAAASPQLDSKERAILEGILKLADIAKFAQHSFKGEEKAELLSNARDFISYDNERLSQKQNPGSADSDTGAKSSNKQDIPAKEFSQDEKAQKK